ncbi:MAG: competence protein ComEC family protein [Roseburia sp.]|nr:competence protein ComEC family protein [Roseburia sp.]
MKKPLNVRMPVLFAACLCAGIVYSTVLAYFRINGIFILIPTLFVIAACIPVACIKGGAFKPLIAISAALIFLVGGVYMYAEYIAYCSHGIAEGISVDVSGRVEDAGVTAHGDAYILLTQVKVNGERINGKIIAYLSGGAGEGVRRGFSVDFYSRLTKQDFISFGEISYNACRNVKYVCTVSGGMKAAYRFNLFGEINYAFKKALFNNLDNETASVCYAMLTGNTDGISAGTLSSFRNGGIAHVFAVSGLHIGVIFGALSLLFKKLGINRYLSTAVRIAFIALYSGVCLFSPSSVRALIMCSVSAIAGCFHRKYDGLNALSVAVIILLLINPKYLYGAGFILSFSAVLGIILLGKNLKRLFGFMPEKFADALSVSLSAQAGILPAQLTSFGYLSASGLILNLVFIPLVSVLYVLLFVCTALSAAIPPLSGALTRIAALPMQLIINLIVTCGFENSVISADFSRLLYLPFALLFIGFTDKLNVKPVFRAAFISAFALIVIFISVTPRGGTGYAKVEFSAGYAGGSVKTTTCEGTVLIVTSNYVEAADSDTSADVLVVLGYDDELAAVTALSGDYKSVVVRASAFPYPSVGETEIVRADNFEVCGVEFTFGGNYLKANVDGAEFAIVYDADGTYAAGESGCGFEAYCYLNDGAVLYAGGGSYDLSFCGTMKFERAGAGFTPAYVIPVE